MAIACFRLVTFFPDFPLRSVPALRSCMTSFTFSCAIVLADALFAAPFAALFFAALFFAALFFAALFFAALFFGAVLRALVPLLFVVLVVIATPLRCSG